MSKKMSPAARIAAGIGLAIGGAALTTAAVYTELMTTVIARRRTPASDALIAIGTGAEPAPLDPEIREMTEALKNAPTELVELRSRDNYVLRAHWYPAEGAKRTVILVHGWHSRWCIDFSASSPFLHENACNLLLIDQRCHGESGGDLISYGINERYDVLTWLDWLDANHGGLPVYLCGISMGAATVLMASALPLPENVVGIIADCPYSSPKAVIQKVCRDMHFPVSVTYPFIRLGARLLGGFSLTEEGAVDAVRESRVPILILHGEDDRFVPCEMSREIAKAAPDKVRLETFPEAGHALSYMVDPVRYRRVTAEFLQSCVNAKRS